MTTAAKVNQESGSHFYTAEGLPAYEVPYKDASKGFRKTTIKDARLMGLLPSSTTILKLLDKPALTAWKIENACLSVLTAPRLANEELDTFVKRVLQTDREQDAESTKAMELGTRIHNAIEVSLNQQGAHDLSLIEFDSFVVPVLKSLVDIGSIRATEKIIVGDNYAGKLDAIVENDTHITVLDFKTCKVIPKSPYEEHLLQLSSYAAALGNTGGKIIRTANIYISTSIPGEIKVVIHDDWQKTFNEGFKPLVQLWSYLNDYQPMAKHLDVFAGC